MPSTSQKWSIYHFFLALTLIATLYATVHIGLIDLAGNLERIHYASCPPERIAHDSTFGSSCTLPHPNPLIHWTIVNFGGPLDILLPVLFGIPASVFFMLLAFSVALYQKKKHPELPSNVKQAVFVFFFLVVFWPTFLYVFLF